MLEYPCTKECPERFPGCHGHCDRYQFVKAQNQQEHNRIAEQKKKEKIADDVRKAGYKRMTDRSKKSIVSQCHKR